MPIHPSRDPLLRLALRLQEMLAPPSPLTRLRLQAERVERLDQAYQALLAFRRQMAKARLRSWHLIADRLSLRLPGLVAEVVRAAESAQAAETARNADESLRRSSSPARAFTPSVRELIEEVRALEQEFGPLHLDLKQRVIAVVTESIELEGLPLGPFRIELHVNRLRHPDAGAFLCVALRPNPAASCSTTTHPHVRDDLPCLGEATVAVSRSVKEGRLLDAFLAVSSVLRNYNPQSPFVPLEEWDGEPCDDCGRRCIPDEWIDCPNCDRRFCDGCSSICDQCNEAFCIGCLDRDALEQNLCGQCQGSCRDCNAVASTLTLEEHAGRCHRCAEDAEVGVDVDGVEATDEPAVSQPDDRSPPFELPATSLTPGTLKAPAALPFPFTVVPV